MADLQDDPQTASVAVGDIEDVRDSAPAAGRAPAEPADAPAAKAPDLWSAPANCSRGTPSSTAPTDSRTP